MASKVAGYIGQIDPGNGTQYALGSTAYGECTIAAATAAKTVEMTGFTLTPGATIHVKFTYSNTVANPTLSVNGTTAKPIMLYGTTKAGTTTETSWAAGSVVSFTYDGTNWVINDFNESVTYESKAAASGGTDLSLVTTGEKYNWNSASSGGVTNVAYDSTNKKITKTVGGTTSDVVSVATLKTDMALNNVENKSSATIRGELTSANVTTALGYTPPQQDTNTHRPIQVDGTQILGDNTTALNLVAGNNISLTNSSGAVTIASTITQPTILQFNVASFSSLPVTINDAAITADHIVLHYELSNRAAQSGDWTVTTAAGSATISGTCLEATTMRLILGSPAN